MATRTRRSAAKSPATKPAAKAASKPATDEEPLERDDSEDAEAGPPAISLTHEDFQNNPRVLDMAAIVDGPGLGAADDDADADGTDDDDDADDGTDEPDAAVEAAAAAKSERARESKAVKASAPAPARGGRVRVRLVGMASAPRARAPHGFTVIVPKGDADYDGTHTEGETVQFTRGRSTSVSRHAFDWLSNHPELVIERA